MLLYFAVMSCHYKREVSTHAYFIPLRHLHAARSKISFLQFLLFVIKAFLPSSSLSAANETFNNHSERTQGECHVWQP